MAEKSRALGTLNPSPGGSRNQSAAATATAAEPSALPGPPSMALPRTGKSITSKGQASSVGGDQRRNTRTTIATSAKPAAYTNGQRRFRFRNIIATRTSAETAGL